MGGDMDKTREYTIAEFKTVRCGYRSLKATIEGQVKNKDNRDMALERLRECYEYCKREA